MACLQEPQDAPDHGRQECDIGFVMESTQAERMIRSHVQDLQEQTHALKTKADELTEELVKTRLFCEHRITSPADATCVEVVHCLICGHEL